MSHIVQRRNEVEVDLGYGATKKVHMGTTDGIYNDMPVDAWELEFKSVKTMSVDECHMTLMKRVNKWRAQYASCGVDKDDHPHHMNWVLCEALRATIVSRIAELQK
jgi:hypothetical protein